MEYIVVIDDDGTLYGVWNDDLIDLYEVERSKVEVERASHVEFCDYCQSWHVWEPDFSSKMSYARFQTRASALAWEKQEIERRLQEEKL